MADKEKLNEVKEPGADVVPFKRTTRRRFLKMVFGLGAFIGAALALPAIPFFRAKYPKAGIKLKTFSDKEFHILSEAARIIIPRGGAFELGAVDIKPEISIDDYFSDFPSYIKKAIKALLYTFEHAPVFYEGTLKTFTMLGDEDKETYLRGWEESNSLLRRRAFEYLKGIIFVGFYSDTKIYAAIGYDYPC